MANVTYLLGAGASYNALPVVDELPKAIENVISVLGFIKNGNSNDYNIFQAKDAEVNINLAISDLYFLRDGCKNHLSIDTFAKMLFLTGDTINYRKAKAVMVLFFQLYSCLSKDINNINNPNRPSGQQNRQIDVLDKRYDAFLASILLEKYDIFPDTIKILSWNYDNQLEKTYKKYLVNAKSDRTVGDVLNKYQKNDVELKFDTSKFGFYKINGSIEYKGKTQNGEFYLNENDTTENGDQPFWQILGRYRECIESPKLLTSCIAFAWDEPEETKRLLETIKTATADTDYLVVIGYSFPFFNRNIDIEILNNLTELRKVYIQDPYAEDIKDSVIAILGNHYDDSIYSIKNTRQFYLPHEL